MLDRLKRAYESNGETDIADDEDELEIALSRILVFRPTFLATILKECLARHTETVRGCATSIRNFLRCRIRAIGPYLMFTVSFRPGLNNWETEFVQLLDREPDGAILWWHRNPPLRPESVRVILSDGQGFYPDFIVGVQGRANEHHAILIDTKGEINRDKAQLEADSEHPVYGRVMLTFWRDKRDWMTVRYNHQQGRSEPHMMFYTDMLAGF